MATLKSKMSKQDLQWQAESDANTMMRYQEIMNDKARRDRAIKEAQRQADDLSKRASVMKSVSKVGSNPRNTGRKK